MSGIICWLFHWTKAGEGRVFVNQIDGKEVARHRCLRCLKRITAGMFPGTVLSYSWGLEASAASAAPAAPKAILEPR